MSESAEEKALEIRRSADISPLGASHAKIDEVASRLSQSWDYVPGSDIAEWVRTKLHGRVFPETSETRLEYGYLRVPGAPSDEGKTAKLDIVLSPYTGEFHNRFTIAHELGHYFLHCLAQNREELVIEREGRNRAETEANWFAEAFLMPREIFVESWNEAEGSIPALIHRFKVAADVITIRYESLKKLNENGFCYPAQWA